MSLIRDKYDPRHAVYSQNMGEFDASTGSTCMPERAPTGWAYKQGYDSRKPLDLTPKPLFQPLDLRPKTDFISPKTF